MGIVAYANRHALGLAAAIVGMTICTASAVTLLEDTWVDGSREEQALPVESQWFSSGGIANLTNNAPGSMTFIAEPTSSRSAITYFATNGLPVSLADGETIQVTLDFTVNGVSENTAQSMRFALVDYSAGARVDADGGSSGLNGANVTGYGFFTHISSLLLRELLDIKERTGVAATDLLGSSSAWETTVAEAFSDDFDGFEAGTPYTMTFSVTRSGDDAIVSNTVTGGVLNVTAVGTNSPGWFSFDAFAFRNSGADETAESFTFTRLLVEGPGGTPSPPSIVAEPQDLIRTVGQAADFSVAASGTQPLTFQWYYTTNSTDTLLVGETNSVLTLPSVGFADAGGYFATVQNESGAATSLVATLAVNAPDPTPPGVVMEDTFEDGDRLNEPISETNSLWFASTSGSLTAYPGLLVGENITGSRLWLGYFTEDPILPVDLAVGTAIKVTMDFTPTNVATWVEGETQRGLRVGLFDYADGGTRIAADGFSTSGGNGANVLGYMFNVNFYTTFVNDGPIEFRARTDTGSGNLIGTTGAYTTLDSGPAGMEGMPGFQSGVPYTMEITVTRTGVNEVDVACRIAGGSLDLQHSVTDSAFPVNRFDALAIRVNAADNAAESFGFSRVRVEVLQATAPPFLVTGAALLDADSFRITWDAVPGTGYRIQFRDSFSAGGWLNGPFVPATETSLSITNTGLPDTRFYRVEQQP
jgi:hypothetical protein